MADQPSDGATVNSNGGITTASTLLENLTSLTVAKQVSLVIALAATFALSIGIAMWSQDENYTLLYGSMDAKDVAEVVQILEQSQVAYKLDPGSGGILVPTEIKPSLRLKLAAQGYPKQAATGYQLLDIDQGFGISQFKETTRYHRALEGELAKSVASINSIKSARVMLGLPKRSVFVRKQQEPSASVVVKLFPGRDLDEQQVNAIVYLVSASIPNMKAKSVTVVDQNGNLLTTKNQLGSVNMSLKQLDYTRMVEETLSGRIVKLLTPIVGGRNKIRAQVMAELDFTEQEQTRENYEPDPQAIRSEQTVEEINKIQTNGGIPGTLTNQPPAAGLAPEESYQSGQDPNLRSSKKKKTKNFELDRTVSHIKNSVGSIRRLSVAVVVDDRLSYDEEGAVVRSPLTLEELTTYRQLVTDTVGLDEGRGDTLTVVNAAFVEPVTEDYGALEIWEQSWFWGVVKQLLAGLGILIIIFAVIKPMLRDLSKQEELLLEYPEDVDEDEEDIQDADDIARALEQLDEDVEETADDLLTNPDRHEELIEKVKTIVAADPKLAAHIIKQWLNEEIDFG